MEGSVVHDANRERPKRPGGPVKVLFIIGKGRSGSTLLDIALGELKGFFSMGEVFGTWVWKNKPTVLEHSCGCDLNVGSCPVWSQVFSIALQHTMGGESQENLIEIHRCEREVARWRAVPRFIAKSGSLADWPELQLFVRFVRELYGAVQEVTGSAVLVDSSKWPANPGPLGLIPGVEPYVIHLVRDPRAVSFSWRRRKRWREDGEPMPVFGPTYSSVSWLGRSVLAEWAVRRVAPRSIRLRYEDFIRDPRRSLETITQFVGEPVENLPLADERTLLLGENHTIMGNASRFATGAVTLRIDDEWQSGMSSFERGWVTLLTSPLLLRYGYPLKSVPEE